MPTCAGDWTHGEERVQWHVFTTPRLELLGMIESARGEIHRKEHVKQCDILIAICRFYRPWLEDDPRLPAAEQKRRAQQNKESKEYNDWLEGQFKELGIREWVYRCLPRNGALATEYAQHSVEQLVDMYKESRAHSRELGCACCQTPGLGRSTGST